MLTSRNLDPTHTHGTPVHHNDHLIGFLVEDAQHRYRFAALDEHFDLLDGSRFVAPHRALAAVARLGRLVDRPLADQALADQQLADRSVAANEP